MTAWEDDPFADVPPPTEPPDDAEGPWEPRIIHGGADTTATTPDPASDLERLWTARPMHAHLRAFAQVRGVAPMAVLGVTIARVLAMVPVRYVLPPLVGGVGTVNQFFGLVGASGGGKGASFDTSEDAVIAAWADPISGEGLWMSDLGSGEGLLKAFCHYEKGAVDGTGIVQHRQSAMFYVPEIDGLTALQQRQGATLMSKFREAWSGGALSFGYSAAEKALRLEKHSYRLTAVVGVQPARCKALLIDGADGGDPQRFIWLPTLDPEAPDDPPPAPAPRHLTLPAMPPVRTEIRVCDEAVAEIKTANRAKLRGQTDPLVGHRLYCQEKLAAGLAALDGHLTTLGITVEDWELAAIVMAVSDREADKMRAQLSARTRKANEAAGVGEGIRELKRTETVDADRIRKASVALRRPLVKLRQGEWMTGGKLRAALGGNSVHRKYMSQALEAMCASGELEMEDVEHNGVPGFRVRLI